MTISISSVSLLGALVALIGLVSVQLLVWQQWRFDWAPGLKNIPRITAGLLGIALTTMSLERKHLPPVGLDEILIALTFLSLLIYLYLSTKAQETNIFFCLSLIITALLMIVGCYIYWQQVPYLGQPPLGTWGSIARWVILGGVAGLLWSASAILVSWWQQIQTRSASVKADEALPTFQQVDDQNVGLQAYTRLCILLGGLLYALRSWWGLADQPNPGLAILVVFLLLLAAWWLRFTWPHRQWWVWTLTLLAFGAALRALPLITI